MLKVEQHMPLARGVSGSVPSADHDDGDHTYPTVWGLLCDWYLSNSSYELNPVLPHTPCWCPGCAEGSWFHISTVYGQRYVLLTSYKPQTPPEPGHSDKNPAQFKPMVCSFKAISLGLFLVKMPPVKKSHVPCSALLSA